MYARTRAEIGDMSGAGCESEGVLFGVWLKTIASIKWSDCCRGILYCIAPPKTMMFDSVDQY